MTLNSVNEGMNKFCGPAVLSILTGKSTDECAGAIAQVSGKFLVQGVTIYELSLAAKKIGFELNEVKAQSYTLFGVVSSLVHEPGLYVVMVPNHFVCVEITEDKKIYFCDNHTKEPIGAASAARMHQRIISIYKASKLPEPKLVESTITVHDSLTRTNEIRIDIYRYDRYIRAADDKQTHLGYTQIHLGYIQTKDVKELAKVIDRLTEACRRYE